MVDVYWRLKSLAGGRCDNSLAGRLVDAKSLLCWPSRQPDESLLQSNLISTLVSVPVLLLLLPVVVVVVVVVVNVLQGANEEHLISSINKH